MSEVSRAILKTYFETGDFPTEAQFIDLIDSLLDLNDDGVGKWQKVTKLFSDFQPDSANTKFIDLFQVPAGFQPINIVFRPTIVFSGGTISGGFAQIYFPGDVVPFSSASTNTFVAITGIRGTVAVPAPQSTNGLFDVSAPSFMRLALTLSGATDGMNDLTQGSITFFYQLMKMI